MTCRVVLDSNVIISGVLFGGPPEDAPGGVAGPPQTEGLLVEADPVDDPPQPLALVGFDHDHITRDKLQVPWIASFHLGALVEPDTDQSPHALLPLLVIHQFSQTSGAKRRIKASRASRRLA